MSRSSFETRVGLGFRIWAKSGSGFKTNGRGHVSRPELESSYGTGVRVGFLIRVGLDFKIGIGVEFQYWG